MTKVAVFTSSEGNVILLYPLNNVCVLINQDGTKDFKNFHGDIPDGYRLATIEEIAAKDCPPGSTWFVNDDENMPDNYFRGAWVHDEGLVSIDMDKAREVHINNLRIERAPILLELDIEEMKATRTAISTGDKSKYDEVISKKQALLDITKNPEIDAATTPEELKIAAINIFNIVGD